MTILITGAAGFIGCRLAQRFIASGKTVAGFDNLSLGSPRNIESLRKEPRFSFQQVDLADEAAYGRAFRDLHARSPVKEVWHLAASSDIPAGVADARVDLCDTFMTTFNTLLFMKALQIDTIAFASTSAVYGDLGERALNEDTGPLFPISNYGAMKLASEAIISAAVESHLERAFIFRFPNVVGTPATHGVILDFVRKLRRTPTQLDVLGDGTQQKGYLHVEELIDAMLFVRERAPESVACYNIGNDDVGVSVKSIAEQVVRHASPAAQIQYGVGNKGWVGDVPRFRYSIDKVRRLGWRPKLSSADAMAKAIGEVVEQESGK